MSNFIIIQPKRNRYVSGLSRKTVRTAFSKNKKNPEKYSLIIYLGKDLAESMNIVATNKIEIAYDEDQPKRLLIKKSSIGYSATEISAKNAPAFRITLGWNLFVPENNNDFIFKKAEHEFVSEVNHEDGLIINI